MENVRYELSKGLSGVTELLNEKRGLWDKYIAGQEFSLKVKEKDEFLISTTYRNGNRGLYAEVKISDGKLDGFITPIKSAKPVASFLHAFSHKYNVPMGFIGSSLEHFF